MLIVQICCIANPTILAMRLIYFVYHSCLPLYIFSLSLPLYELHG